MRTSCSLLRFSSALSPPVYRVGRWGWLPPALGQLILNILKVAIQPFKCRRLHLQVEFMRPRVKLPLVCVG